MKTPAPSSVTSSSFAFAMFGLAGLAGTIAECTHRFFWSLCAIFLGIAITFWVKSHDSQSIKKSVMWIATLLFVGSLVCLALSDLEHRSTASTMVGVTLIALVALTLLPKSNSVGKTETPKRD